MRKIIFTTWLLTMTWFGTAIVSGQDAATDTNAERPIKIVAPADNEALATFLSTTLRWEYAARPRAAAPFPFLAMKLEVADNEAFASPIVKATVDDHQTSYRMALEPEKKYFWRLIPLEQNGEPKTNLMASASFTTSRAWNRYDEPDTARYKNPRPGAHWQYLEPVVPKLNEPLSPWFDVKAYRGGPPPQLADIKAKFPVPVWEGHPEALAAYWYCWDTLLRVWVFAPKAPDHQAVANLLGYPNWGPWGSTMVFDSCFILHFSRYGAQAYPFITCLDNCYARQHENGFICRESDRENREVYATFPVNPPLFAWAEWEWYRVTGDKERLRRVLMPLVKHYEWWMTYQRRENGLYWVDGVNEADDSPRNELMHYSVSATSYQALAALYLGRIAHEAGREDLRKFFDAQHEELKTLVNEKLWDDEHHLYNDLTKDEKFITELEPGSLCKHVHMFWPLIAEIAPPERMANMVAELKNPKSFDRSSGIPSLSADSKGYNAANGQYWRGAVWPSAQCMVQEGLRAAGQGDFLRATAEKYYNACLTAYRNDKTIKENIAPDQPVGFGAVDFVGWGGVGPVANLIEYVLGFDINAPEQRIDWHITKPEKHGLENLQFNGFKVDMICEARDAKSKTRRVTVNSGGAFTLKVSAGGQSLEKKITTGSQTFEIAEAAGTN